MNLAYTVIYYEAGDPDPYVAAFDGVASFEKLKVLRIAAYSNRAIREAGMIDEVRFGVRLLSYPGRMSE